MPSLKKRERLHKHCACASAQGPPEEVCRGSGGRLLRAGPRCRGSALVTAKQAFCEAEESMTISWTLGGSNEPGTSHFGGRSQKEVLFSDIIFRDVLPTCSPLRLVLNCEPAAAMPRVTGCEEFKATL